MDNKNTNDKIIKVRVQQIRQMFPKGNKDYEDGGFAIQKVKVKDTLEGNPQMDFLTNEITIKGNMPYLHKDKIYVAMAKEIYDETFGYSYDVLYVTEDYILDTEEKQRIFFGAFLTPKQVDALFKEYEKPLDTVFSENIEGLTKISGIGEVTAKKIIEKAKAHKDNSKAYVELTQMGIPINYVNRIITAFTSSEEAITVVKNNPYILSKKIDGFGFKTADSIALKIGLSPVSTERISAFIMHFLQEQASLGKSFVARRDLMSGIITTLNFYVDDIVKTNIAKSLHLLKEADILWWDKDKTILALCKYRNIEREIALEIFRIYNAKREFKSGDYDTIIKAIEEKQGWKHTDEQYFGIKQTLEHNVVLITGLGGTGKSTITNAMRKIYDKNNYYISQCALSGKASQRIAEVTQSEASTIHRLLRFTNGKFTKGKKDPLDSDVVVIDEASMPNAELFLSLLQAIPNGSKLIILGDYGQLTSIGLGNVFMDLFNSGAVPTIKLTKIHRQAQASAIITKSIDVRLQKQLFDKNFRGEETLGELQDLHLDIDLYKQGLDEKILNHFEKRLKVEKDNIKEVQIVTSSRARGDLSCYNLNKKAQQRFNPNFGGELFLESNLTGRNMGDKKYQFFLGDKVIITKNYYNAKTTSDKVVDVFNGNIGTIVDINLKKVEMTVDVDGVGFVVIPSKKLNTIELGYAITTHKSQGSQYNSVIVALDMSCFMLLSCELLYTAITRAIKHCTLVGENQAIQHAIRTRENAVKNTFLPSFLKEIKEEKNLIDFQSTI